MAKLQQLLHCHGVYISLLYNPMCITCVHDPMCMSGLLKTNVCPKLSLSSLLCILNYMLNKLHWIYEVLIFLEKDCK